MFWQGRKQPENIGFSNSKAPRKFDHLTNLTWGPAPTRNSNLQPREIFPLNENAKINKVSRIGDGANGIVYRAYIVVDKKIKNVIEPLRIAIALKRPKNADDSGEAFKKEASILKSLNHSHIMWCGDYVDQDGIRGIVMERCEGGSLTNLIEQISEINLHIQVKFIAKWSIQIADAIQYLHNKNILHRDIKTQNVMLVERPCICQKRAFLLKECCKNCNLNNLTLKLGDFGTAGEENNENKTIYGTIQWMAPEYVQTLFANKATDIWSYGVFLWELLTGSIPYSEYDMDKWGLFLYIGLGYASITIPTDCPKEFQEILKACWDLDPNARATIDVILEMLKCVLKSKSAKKVHKFCVPQSDIKESN
uniref:Protein kinase domain-containing protein n=1 Tax=Acrobeloides nanus TaxID=290746 RepID=A0A914ELR1_9BILA